MALALFGLLSERKPAGKNLRSESLSPPAVVPHPLFGCDTNDRLQASRQHGGEPQHVAIRVAIRREAQPLNRYLVALRPTMMPPENDWRTCAQRQGCRYCGCKSWPAKKWHIVARGLGVLID